MKAAALLAALTVAAVPGIASAGNAGLDHLREVASWWMEHGRPDLAAAALRKLLRSEPRNAEALADLSACERRVAEGGHGRIPRAGEDLPPGRVADTEPPAVVMESQADPPAPQPAAPAPRGTSALAALEPRAATRTRADLAPTAAPAPAPAAAPDRATAPDAAPDSEPPPTDPSWGARMRVLAARAVARRDFARGLAMLREVVARHPEDAEASIDLADRLLAHGDSGAARRLVDRLGGIDDVRVRLLHARVNADEKGASRALAAIPAGGPAGEGRVARWWSGLRIRAELATAPADCPPATTRRCVAIEVLENESEADPDSLARVAWAWARAGRTDRAAAAVRRVVAAPDATAWHRLRGAGVLAAVGDFDGVESALRAASGTVTARESRAHDDLSAALAVHKAKRERAAGLPGDAVRRLEPLVSARPGDADALVALGLAYADIGLRAAASQAAERAVRLRPSEPELWIDAARCFRAAGDDTRAGEAIRQALALLDDPARRRTAAAGENPVPAGVRALLGRGKPADPQRLRMEIESSGL